MGCSGTGIQSCKGWICCAELIQRWLSNRVPRKTDDIPPRGLLQRLAGAAPRDDNIVRFLVVKWKHVCITRFASVHMHTARVRVDITRVHLERSEDRRLRLGGCGRALKVRQQLGSCGGELGASRGLGWRGRRLRGNRRPGDCRCVRDGLDHGRGGRGAAGLGLERCRRHRRFGRRRRRRHLGRCRRRRRLGRRRHLGRRLHRLRADRLGLGLRIVVLDEENAVGLDRVDGAGAPTDRDALGARVGARVRKRARLGDRLGL
eukprot:scaffold9703_cov67-Phaeocystis_antarctica.AAC.4